MQAYVIGSDKAVPFYQKAFRAQLINSYLNDNGTYFHSELDIEGVIFAMAERSSDFAIKGENVTGNIMQFCLHYGEGNEDKVKNAYDILKEDAEILIPLAPSMYSPLMADLIDKYGVRWCLFV